MKEAKEISLLNMCFYILSKWKILMIAALAGGILAGTVSYLDNYKELKNNLVVSEIDPLSRINLTKEEINVLEAKISVIKEYEENIEEYDYYLENSIKVKLNPNKFYQGMLTYYFEADDYDNVEKAKAICKTEISNESKYEELAILLKDTTDAALLKEVIFIGEEVIQQGYENGQFCILVEHYNENECKTMLDFYAKQMETLRGGLVSKGITVTIQEISSDIKTATNLSFIELSNQIKAKRSSAYDNVSALEAKLTEPQKEYYNFVYGENKTNVETFEVTNIDQKPEVNMKLTVVGIVAVAFFVSCLYGAIYVLSNQVHTKEELESWLPIPVYEYKTDSKRKHGFIDVKLKELEKMLSGKVEENPEMIAQMIANTAKLKEVKKIYLTGSVDNFDIEALKEIAELISKEDVDVTMGKNILKDAKALQDAADCGYVVFVEKCNVSNEKDIRLEVTKANTCNINILGMILEG